MVNNGAITPRTLQDWVGYIQTLHFRSIDLTLERIAIVAQRLGIRGVADKVFTITGTNGKGSSVATLEALCSEHELRYGAFTSPHLVRFNERIRVNGKSVADNVIVAAFEKIESAREEISLTYFEFNALAALLIFSESNLDVAILEVGMGGRLDATNIIDADYLIMTNIALDHTQWLGDSREKIGYEKAGLMRQNQQVFFGEEDCPKSVIEQASKHNVHWHQFGKDWQIAEKSPKSWRLALNDNDNWLLDKPRLKGQHQIQNAATSILAFRQFLLDTNQNFQLSNVNTALNKQYLPGRLDARFLNDKRYIFEVGHNPAAINAVVEYLKEERINDLLVVLTFLDDKDATTMLNALSPFASSWVGVKIEHERARSFEAMTTLLSSFEEAQVINGIENAVDFLKTLKNNRNDVLVIGSFFLVGDIMRALNLPVFE